MSVLNGVGQVIDQPLYDSAPVATSGTTVLTLFQNPIGQGTTAFGSGSKTLRDTNMRLAGMLPGGYKQTVKAISIAAWTTAATATTDLALALAGCVLTFTLGSKVSLEVPAIKLPGGVGVEGFGTTASIQAAHNGIGDARSIKVLAADIEIPEQLSFSVTLTWPGGAPTLTAAVPLTVFLEGLQQRPVQ